MTTRITLLAASMFVWLLVGSTNALAIQTLDAGVAVVQDVTTTRSTLSTLDAGTVARTQSQVEAIGETVLGGTDAPAPSTYVPSVPQSSAPLPQPRQTLPATQGTSGSQPAHAAPSPTVSAGVRRQGADTRSSAGSRKHNADTGRRTRHPQAGRGGRARASAASVSDRGPREIGSQAGGSFGAHNPAAYRITDECCDATPRPPGEPSIGFDSAWGVGGDSAVNFGIGTLLIVLIAAVLLIGARTNAKTERV